MITFTWKYGKEPFLFEEMFDEQRDSDDILDHSREDNTEARRVVCQACEI